MVYTSTRDTCTPKVLIWMCVHSCYLNLFYSVSCIDNIFMLRKLLLDCYCIIMNSKIKSPTLCMPLKCSHIAVPFSPISSDSKPFSKYFFPLDNACIHIHVHVYVTINLKVKFKAWVGYIIIMVLFMYPAILQFTWTVQSDNVYFSSCSVSPFNENCQEFNLKLYEV